eukprot:4593699-Pleurochrysis_carterae.AAC.1
MQGHNRSVRVQRTSMPRARACSTQNTASDGLFDWTSLACCWWSSSARHGQTSLAPQGRSSLARREWTSLACR